MGRPTRRSTAIGDRRGERRHLQLHREHDRAPASPVGTYPIVPVATGANLANYTVVYVNGTLTVGQATLTVTAGNASRAYGAANPAFTASATGAVNGDTFSFTESTTATTARRSAPIRSFRWRLARTSPTTPWSTSTAP